MGAILTLSELQEITQAYDAFSTVEQSDLPDYYKQIFPKQCECGAEVILTNSDSEQGKFTQLQCCNPDCWIKMAHRFVYFMKSLGFKGFGVSSALPLYKAFHEEFKYPSFLCIFDIPTSAIRPLIGDASTDLFADIKNTISSSTWQFKNAIVALGIPDIGNNCAIFNVVKDPATFLSMLLKNRIRELCNMAGIYSEKTIYNLSIYCIDVTTLMTQVMPHIASTPNKEIHVAITGSVSVDGRAMTRAEFIWKCESILDKEGKQVYKLVETKAASKLDYVIADSPSNSSKYQLGAKLNKLITAQEFYDILKSNVRGESNA